MLGGREGRRMSKKEKEKGSHGHKQQYGDCGRLVEGTEGINGGGKLNEEKNALKKEN